MRFHALVNLSGPSFDSKRSLEKSREPRMLLDPVVSNFAATPPKRAFEITLFILGMANEAYCICALGICRNLSSSGPCSLSIAVVSVFSGNRSVAVNAATLLVWFRDKVGRVA